MKAGTFADGIELRAAGTYVLLPPSPHSTGVRYEARYLRSRTCLHYLSGLPSCDVRAGGNGCTGLPMAAAS